MLPHASFYMLIQPLLGTYTGHYEPVKEMADLLDEYQKKTGHDVPIHGLYSPT
jgi:hypothetical protein